jgi:hypothetical protein
VSSSSAIISGLIPELYKLRMVFLCSGVVEKSIHLHVFLKTIYKEMFFDIV